MRISGIASKDERGSFERLWCERTAAAADLSPNFAQWSLSTNLRYATVRGFHFQTAPHSESKLVRCVQGRLFDVAVDLREDQPTYGNWVSATLSDDNHEALYIPPGVAHGYMTMSEPCVILYGITPAYEASAAAGVRWDDPDINIDWPDTPSVISERDLALPYLRALNGQK